MIIRPRRMRKNDAIRRMTRETRVSSHALVQPVFIREGENITEPIPSLIGQSRYSSDTVAYRIEELLKNGVASVLLFGIPETKDELGSGAYDENGALQKAVREIKKRFPEMFIITDVCMCEYTSHGHCGIIENNYVNNDRTLPFLSKIALSHAEAGSDMVAPSDMMDGRVLAIRTSLDEAGYEETPILSYSVKYSSAFYGPFREAAVGAPVFGDRKSHQMDFHNKKEAVREARLDISQGADMIMVKPAICYLDIIRDMAEGFDVPVAAYSVSGEYAMIKAAAKDGLIDEYNAMCESAVSIWRAGADILITYFAKELSGAILKGDIG